MAEQVTLSFFAGHTKQKGCETINNDPTHYVCNEDALATLKNTELEWTD